MNTVARWVRSKVSGDKKRYNSGVFDLDLTYITDRVVAMAFPASGVESAYRNDISEVSDMLNSEHPGKFRVYNLTERSYDYTKFQNSVAVVGWPDHHAPPLAQLFRIMSDMHAYLRADPQNVVVIHCLAGKGRTGTVITCYLLFSGLFKEVEEASRFFAIKRSVNNWGVTGPSQQRYIEFFHHLLTTKTRPSSGPMQLKHIIVLNCPRLSVGGAGGKPGFTPNIVISDTNVGLGHKILWQTKEQKTMLADRDNRMQIDVDDCVLHGDVNITIQHITSFGRRQKFGRIDFNTAMVPNNLVYVLKKEDIDDADKDKRVPSDFQLLLVFEPPSASWQPRTDIVVQETDEFWQRVFYQSAGQDGAACFWWNEALTRAINDARALSDSRLGVAVERGGYLTKRGHKVKNWKRRWFVLHPDTLEYYASPKDNKPRGVIKLDDIQTVQILDPADSEMPNSFIIYTNWDDYICYAANDDEMENWVDDILMALHIRETKRGKVEVLHEDVLGQLSVKVLELQNDPRASNYFVVILGGTRFKTEPNAGKEMTFDIKSMVTHPLLVQLWEAHQYLPDEISGEIRIALDALTQANVTVPLELDSWYGFRRRTTQVRLKLTYKPKPWLDYEKTLKALELASKPSQPTPSPLRSSGRVGLTNSNSRNGLTTSRSASASTSSAVANYSPAALAPTVDTPLGDFVYRPKTPPPPTPPVWNHANISQATLTSTVPMLPKPTAPPSYPPSASLPLGSSPPGRVQIEPIEEITSSTLQEGSRESADGIANTTKPSSYRIIFSLEPEHNIAQQ